MKKHEGLSKYKFKRLAVESLRNSIRLHLDSISLFEIGSYPSAFQLSVLALEEFSKSQWLEHYIYTAETNDGYPDKEFENKWLRLLYSHPEKQWAFIARDLTDFSPTFSEFVENGKLEQKKQSATYVSLPRIKGKVDIGGRISVPIVKIKLKDAKQLISFINSEFLTICWRIHDDEFYFDVEGMDEVFNDPIFMKLLSWPYKSRISSIPWARTLQALELNRKIMSLDPLFNKDCELVGWIEPDEHIFDTSMQWVAYVRNDHAWSGSTPFPRTVLKRRTAFGPEQQLYVAS